MDFNSDNRFAPQQNISCKMNIMTEIFGLGASKAGIHPRTLKCAADSSCYDGFYDQPYKDYDGQCYLYKNPNRCNPRTVDDTAAGTQWPIVV